MKVRDRGELLALAADNVQTLRYRLQTELANGRGSAERAELKRAADEAVPRVPHTAATAGMSIEAQYAAHDAATLPTDRFERVEELETWAERLTRTARTVEYAVEHDLGKLRECVEMVERCAQAMANDRSLMFHTAEELRSPYTWRLEQGLHALIAGVVACELPLQKYVH